MIKIPFFVSDPDLYKENSEFATEHDPERGGWYPVAKTEESETEKEK